jgi:MtfA peptidase
MKWAFPRHYPQNTLDMAFFSLLTRWKRKRILRTLSLDDQLFDIALARLPFLGNLTRQERQALKDWVIVFLAEKEWVGAGGFVLTDSVRLSIALQACLPVMALDIDLYDGWHGIIVYADEVSAHREVMDEAGVTHVYDEPLSGEAMPGGPVVLSWNDVAMAEDWDNLDYNVVIHEFAHKLDMLSGGPDGIPPRDPRFHADTSPQHWRLQWQATLGHAYQDFFDRVNSCKSDDDFAALPLDQYGAEHESEFFAVASESFFTAPDLLQTAYPALYHLMKAFYRQDPLARMQRQV